MITVINKKVHHLPDTLLTARAVRWMNSETNKNWWIMSFTSEGVPLSASSSKEYSPSLNRQLFAKQVCEYVNLQNNAGGAWMAGYVDKDYPEQFYLLWKDFDGDIRIPIEFPQPFSVLQEKWSLDNFLNHTVEALGALKEYEYAMAFSENQVKSLAKRTV